MSSLFRRPRAAGGALAPVIIIIVALAISAAVFFLFTKKRMEANREAEAAAAAEAEAAGNIPPPEETTPAAPQKGSLPAPVTGADKLMRVPADEEPGVKAPAVPRTFAFTNPSEVADQLTRSLAAGDMAGAAKIIAAGRPAQETEALNVLEKIKALGYKAGAAEDVQVVGQVENSMRLSIPLLKPDGTVSEARIQIDVEKDAAMGWKIGSIRLPKEFSSIVAAAPMPQAAAPTVNPNGGAPLGSSGSKPLILVESGGPDAINFASEFVKDLLKLDYNGARKFVDEEKVPAVKLAGLCIVFEDGKYTLQENKPLLATVATEDTSWIIARVKSDLRKEETEFGIEMEKANGQWRIMGLNLSKLLADNAKSSASVGVPYTPLVQNPKGGECIALYYEYDSAVLHPRAQAQLKIAASVLKSSPAKKLKITGHTDAMGTDTYNIALSQRRAEAVKKFFLDQGVPATQLETTGIGKALPLSPNANPDGSDNPEGRSHNRRAEILLDF